MDFAMLMFGSGLWGMFVSYVEERFGKFEQLSPRLKQTVNGFLTFVVPLLTEFFRVNADPEQVIGLTLFFVPAIAWLSSQVAHGKDPATVKNRR